MYRLEFFHCDDFQRSENIPEGEHLGSSVSRNTLERGTIAGNSPVCENISTLLDTFLEYHKT